MATVNVEWADVIFGLAAAIFGAVLTAVVSLLQQWRDAAAERQRRADDAERRKEDKADAAKAARHAARTDARIAARIVRVDAEQARERLSLALKNRQYWSPEYTLPQESWAEYRE